MVEPVIKQRASRIPKPPSKKLSPEERREWVEGLAPNQREVFEQRIRQMAGERAQQELMDVLANGDFRFFRKHWSAKIYRLSESEFKTVQEQLRHVWNPDTQTEKKNGILVEWLRANGGATARADWDRGLIWVNPNNLTAELASLMITKKSRLSVCQNPECASPYFVAPKKGRKYCEQGGCTAYAQRKYARESWQRKHGKTITER